MMAGAVGRVVCMLVLVPSLAAAQRGMGGGGRGGRPNGIARDSGLTIPPIMNGVNLLIEHRQDLTLSDSQFVHIIALKRSLDSTNSPLERTLDSLQYLFGKGAFRFAAPSPAHRDSLEKAHIVLTRTQVAIRENIATWKDKAYALLSDAQAMKAQAIEDAAAAPPAAPPPGGI